MPLLLNPDTMLSSLIVTTYSHNLEKRETVYLLVRYGELVYIMFLPFYFLKYALEVLKNSIPKGWTR